MGSKAREVQKHRSMWGSGKEDTPGFCPCQVGYAATWLGPHGARAVPELAPAAAVGLRLQVGGGRVLPPTSITCLLR